MTRRRSGERLILVGATGLVVALVLPIIAARLAGDPGGTVAVGVDFLLVPASIACLVGGALAIALHRRRTDATLSGPPISSETLLDAWSTLGEPLERERLGDIAWEERCRRVRALADAQGIALPPLGGRADGRR